jgi:hypothetical protein
MTINNKILSINKVISKYNIKLKISYKQVIVTSLNLTNKWVSKKQMISFWENLTK